MSNGSSLNTDKPYSPQWVYSATNTRTEKDKRLFEFLSTHTLENKLKKKRLREERQLAKEADVRNEKALSRLQDIRWKKMEDLKFFKQAELTTPTCLPGSPSTPSPLPPSVTPPSAITEKSRETSSELLHYFTSMEVMDEDLKEGRAELPKPSRGNALPKNKRLAERVQPLVLWDLPASDQKFLFLEAYSNVEQEYMEDVGEQGGGGEGKNHPPLLNPRFITEPLTEDQQVEAHELIMRVLLHRHLKVSAYVLAKTDCRHTLYELQEPGVIKQMSLDRSLICKQHESVSHPYMCELKETGICFCLPESLSRRTCGCEFSSKEEDCHLVGFAPGFVYRSHLLQQSMIATGKVVVCAVSGTPHNCYGIEACTMALLNGSHGDWTCSLTKHITSGLFINIPVDTYCNKFKRIIDSLETGGATSGLKIGEEDLSHSDSILHTFNTDGNVPSAKPHATVKITSVKKAAMLKQQELGISSTFAYKCFDRLRTNKGNDRKAWYRSLDALQTSTTNITNTTRLALSFLNPTREISDYFTQKNHHPHGEAEASPHGHLSVSPLDVISGVSRSLCTTKPRFRASGAKVQKPLISTAALKSWIKGRKKMLEVFPLCTLDEEEWGADEKQSSAPSHKVSREKTAKVHLESVVDFVMKRDCLTNSTFCELSNLSPKTSELNGKTENLEYRAQWKILRACLLSSLEILCSLRTDSLNPKKITDYIPGFSRGEWTYLISFMLRVAERSAELPDNLSPLNFPTLPQGSPSLVSKNNSGNNSPSTDVLVKKKLTAVGVRYFRAQAMANM